TVQDVSMPRGSLAGQLAAMGFADTARAQQLLAALGLEPGRHDALPGALAAAADPDQALAALSRMAPGDELLAALDADDPPRPRGTAVRGAAGGRGDLWPGPPADGRLRAGAPASPARPADARSADLLTAVGAAPASAEPEASAADGDPATRLRVAYRRQLL